MHDILCLTILIAIDFPNDVNDKSKKWKWEMGQRDNNPPK